MQMELCILVAIERFNIAANDFSTNKFVRFNQVLGSIEFVSSKT